MPTKVKNPYKEKEDPKEVLTLPDDPKYKKWDVKTTKSNLEGRDASKSGGK